MFLFARIKKKSILSLLIKNDLSTYVQTIL